MSDTTAAIQLTDVRFHYGKGPEILRIPEFRVEKGEKVFLFGPSGSGKTTLLGVLAGVLGGYTGSVEVLGRDISKMSGSQRDAFRGSHLGYIFQLFNLIPYLSVLENVTVGALHRRPQLGDARAHAERILTRLGLIDRRHQLAQSLTLPDRKRLEVARALATDPKLLLLDEVMAGLRPTEVDVMVGFLRELNAETGLTVLLIEHVMRAVMALAAHVVVVSYGEKIAEGTPQEITRHPAVLEVYLGGEDAP